MDFEQMLKDSVIVNQWTDARGVKHDNYQCKHCQFTTLDKPRMVEHLNNGDHPYTWPEGKGPVGIPYGGE